MPATAEITIEEARPLHYVFAHYALRNEAFLDPEHLLNAMRSQDHEYLKHQWFKAWAVCARSGTRPDAASLPVEEIRLAFAERKGITSHIVIMPEAKGITEAIFVAIVRLPGGNVRYFTLENSVRADGSPRTCFCEWTSDESHLNFGDGPEATVGAFTDRIFQHINPGLLTRVKNNFRSWLFHQR